MKKFKIEPVYPASGEWLSFDLTLVISEEDAKKTIRRRTKSGGWATYKKVRTDYKLSFNGKKFSDNEGLKAMGKKFSPNVVRYQLSRCRKIYADYMAIDPNEE